MSKPAVVVMHEPMRIFVSVDRLLLPLLSVVLMMEESLEFFDLGTCPWYRGGTTSLRFQELPPVNRTKL